MDPHRWQQIDDLFNAVIDCPPENRGRLLTQRCGDDSALRSEIESLLSAHDRSSHIIDLKAFEVAPRRPAREAPGRLTGCTIGHYRVSGFIGAGGCGAVYEAEQENPRRMVALKVMRALPYRDELTARFFRREGQALARLQHPGIAAIYEAGQTRDGWHYFAMERVDGRALTDYARAKNLSLEERLELFGRICDAVQYAHQRGVIHRDLKPSNILVRNDGQPKVLDFGLARITDPDSGITHDTQPGAFQGTLAFASPEQAHGNPEGVDIRTDVYSLGVILYVLLTGCHPYPVMGQMAEILKHISATPPIPPRRGWKRESGVTHRRGGRLKSGRCPINDEVETIVLRALSKERERRYQSAGELARDVGNYLAGRPIEAKRDSTGYLVRKFIRRHRIGLAIAAVFLLMVIDFQFVTAKAYRRTQEARLEAERALVREERQRRQTVQERDRAQRTADFMGQLLSGAGPWAATGRDASILREMMDLAVKRIEDGELAAAPEAELQLRQTIGITYEQMAVYDAAARMFGPIEEMARSLHGEGSIQYATALSYSAELLESQGDIKTALARNEAALTQFRNANAGDHDRLATSLHDKARCLRELGRTEEALTHYRQALEMRSRLNPGDNQHVASTLNDLALCLQQLGHAEDALPQHRAALEMRQRLFQGDHPEIAQGSNNVAFCLGTLGRFEEALPMHQASLEMRQRLFKGDHPWVAIGLNNLAYCLMQLGRLEEALPEFQAALEMRQRLHNIDHPWTAIGLNNLALCLRALGRFEEALPLLEKALEMRRRLFPDDHAEVAKSLDNVAVSLVLLGRSEEALARHEAALAMYRRLFSGDHQDVAGSLNLMGRCLLSLDRPADAEQSFRECLAMRERLFPDGNARAWLRFSAKSWLGSALVAQVGKRSHTPGECIEKLREAEPLLRDALEKLESDARVPPPTATDDYKREALKRIVELYYVWHSIEPGKGYDVREGEWRSRLAAWQATTQRAVP